ncbi:hypothetical protein ACA910_016131 [Epithemia clementina (nom. ined.)]
MYQLAATSVRSSGKLMGSSCQSHNKSAAAAAAATAATGGGCQEALRKFIHLPIVLSAISEASFMNAQLSPLLGRYGQSSCSHHNLLACMVPLETRQMSASLNSAAAAAAILAAMISEQGIGVTGSQR